MNSIYCVERSTKNNYAHFWLNWIWESSIFHSREYHQTCNFFSSFHRSISAPPIIWFYFLWWRWFFSSFFLLAFESNVTKSVKREQFNRVWCTFFPLYMSTFHGTVTAIATAISTIIHVQYKVWTIYEVQCHRTHIYIA